jgi:dethiobiotin synthetase
MTRGLFVTGTDTGCGKTEVTVALLQGLRARRRSAVGFKPVASGARLVDGKLRNDDALALWRAGEPGVSYDDINPYCFAPAIAPHLAAREQGVEFDMSYIRSCYQRLAGRADWVLVEGAGGWRVPLGELGDMQSLAIGLGQPVLLVVGLRLGCINHALLTEQALLGSGAVVIGWVGSTIDPGMARLGENIATLKGEMTMPCLGVLDATARAGRADEIVARVLGAAPSA